jgi:hypothetical protein
LLILRCGHIARDPHAKHFVAGKGSVAASLAVLPLVMHNLASTWIGNTLVQVAVSSHTDEREVGPASRAFHVRREQVKPHWKPWHQFTSSRGLAACRTTAPTEVANVAGWDVNNDVRHTPGRKAPCATTESRLRVGCPLAVRSVVGTRAAASLSFRLNSE